MTKKNKSKVIDSTDEKDNERSDKNHAGTKQKKCTNPITTSLNLFKDDEFSFIRSSN